MLHVIDTEWFQPARKLINPYSFRIPVIILLRRLSFV